MDTSIVTGLFARHNIYAHQVFTHIYVASRVYLHDTILIHIKCSHTELFNADY